MIREGTPEQVRDGAAEWSIVTGDGPAGLASLGRVDHVITDPPYEAEAHTKGRRAGGGNGVREEIMQFGAMDAATRARMGEAVSATVRRWALVFCQGEAPGLWRDALAGMRHVRVGAWVKPHYQPQFTGDRPAVGWEAIEIAHKRGGRMRWNGGGTSAVWSCDPLDDRRVNGTHHQCQKPLALMLDLVRLFTDAGDIIADPFCGSGTTVIAALSLGRRCVAWEEKPQYADVARERVRAWCSGNTVSAARAGQTTIMDRLGGGA